MEEQESARSFDVEFEPEFYLIAFASSSHCMETEKKARERFRVHIIPTPREISASCGMALRFSREDVSALGDFFQGLDVPSQFYAFSAKGEGGKRRAVRLGAREVK